MDFRFCGGYLRAMTYNQNVEAKTNEPLKKL